MLARLVMAWSSRTFFVVPKKSALSSHHSIHGPLPAGQRTQRARAQCSAVPAAGTPALRLAAQRLGVADHDDPTLGPGQRDVQPAPVAQEAALPGGVRTDLAMGRKVI